MIEHIAIRHWQSLANVDLELARFTVIVGPSSSGKSALMRALRAVASNVSGTDKITRGQKNAAITVRTGEAIVTLEYGRFSNDTAPGWFYRLTPAGGKEQVYTKLNRAVPEQITAALRIDPVPSKGVSINFAGQHDGPYLLGDTGASVARVLGELTGVDRIFDASREALRIRNSLAGTLRTREADLVELTAQAHEFADLPVRVTALREAEAQAENIACRQDQLDRLGKAIDQLNIAERVLAQAVLPQVPSMEAVEAAQKRLDSFTALWRIWADRKHSADQWDTEAAEQLMLEHHLEHELEEALQRAGVCPTCGRPS